MGLVFHHTVSCKRDESQKQMRKDSDKREAIFFQIPNFFFSTPQAPLLAPTVTIVDILRCTNAEAAQLHRLALLMTIYRQR